MAELERYIHVIIKDRKFINYTGVMFGVPFEDGRTTAKMHINDAIRMGAVFACETEDGEVINPLLRQMVLREQCDLAGCVDFVVKPTQEKEFVTPILDLVDEDKAPVLAVFTREELEAIADTDGIRGLRDVAELRGVKGRSIEELIDELLAAQEV